MEMRVTYGERSSTTLKSVPEVRWILTWPFSSACCNVVCNFFSSAVAFLIFAD